MSTKFSNFVTIPVTAAEATTGVIPFGSDVVGRVEIPTGSTITSLTWYDHYLETGTFVAAYDETGAALVTVVAAGRSYPIPSDLAGSRFLKAVGDAAGTIYVHLKG